MKKHICGILAGLLVFSATSCNGNGSQSTGNDNTYMDYVGTHIMTATDTNDYLVQYGTSQYSLLVPQDSSNALEVAQEEFNYFFKMATGIALPIKVDNGTITSEGKYISIGETSLFEKSGVEASLNVLGTEGARIATVDDDIYLVGATDFGTLNAVYDFLTIMFDFDCYYLDCYEIKTGQTNVRLKNFDVTDVPDIKYRATNYGFYKFNETYDESRFGYRMRRYTNYGGYYIPIHTEFDNPNSYATGAHNSFCYLPVEQYAAQHPEWYSSDKSQLCYTAGGDKESFNEMTRLCADKIINSLKIYTPEEYPYYRMASITIEDNNLTCQCDSCTGAALKYGSIAATTVMFANKVNEYLREWMNAPENAEYYREDFTITTFAYLGYVAAPVKWDNKQKKYVATAPEVECAPGTGIWLAPLGSLDYQVSFFDESNSAGKSQYDTWATLTDHIDFWFYATNFSCYMVMYDMYSFYDNAMYKYLANDGKTNMFFAQTQGRTAETTAFNAFFNYLESKLMWNANADVELLTDKFFKAMYGDASDTMYNLFMNVRMKTAEVNGANRFYRTGSVYNVVLNENCWEFITINNWIKAIDQAHFEIKNAKAQDEKYYQRTEEHIEREWMSYGYMMLELYQDWYNVKDLRALKDRFINNVLRFRFDIPSEHGEEFSKYIKKLY